MSRRSLKNRSIWSHCTRFAFGTNPTVKVETDTRVWTVKAFAKKSVCAGIGVEAFTRWMLVILVKNGPFSASFYLFFIFSVQLRLYG